MSRFRTITFVSLLSAIPVALPAQKYESGGNGTFYLTTYSSEILIMAESTMTVTKRIPFGGGLPTFATFNKDRSHAYITTARGDLIRIFDLVAGKKMDSVYLTTGNTRVSLQGFGVDPTEKYAIMVINTTKQLPDRYEIGKPKLVRYQFATRTVSDTIPWPDGEDRPYASFMFSPDGKYLYFLGEEILIYDAATMKIVDRWAMSQPLEPGLGRFGFTGLGWGYGGMDYDDEPGFFTGFFTTTDPVQNRPLIGVARVNLPAKSVEYFYTIGPASDFIYPTMSLDRKRAYGIKSTIGHYEFWSFDLENRRLTGRTWFEGRPRMALSISTNGRQLYVYGAGNTIDIYDTATMKKIRTVAMDSDIIMFSLVPRSRTARR